MMFEKLPPEIYLNIFSYLSKPTLANCQRVCKACQPAATQALCKQVVLSKSLLKKIRSKNQAPCIFARSLEIKLFHSFADTIDESDISALFGFLPRLKLITFSYTCSSDKVAFFLLEMLQMEKSALSQIEEINVSYTSNSSAIRDLYLSINYQLCNTIKRLKLNGLRGFYIKGDNIHILDYLKHFKCLRKLVISPSVIAVQQQNASINDFNLFDIFFVCPNLEEFGFETYQLLGQADPKECPKYNAPVQSLQHFSFKALNLPSSHVPFLLDFILPQVKTFKFRLTEASIDEGILDQYMDKFASHLKHIKQLNVSSTPLTRDTLRNATILTNIWKCISNVKSHSPSLVTSLRIFGGKYHATGLSSLELDSSEHNLKITVHVYADDADVYNSCLLHSLKAGIGPHVLNEIHIDDLTSTFTPLCLIDHVLLSCQQLKGLTVYSSSQEGGRVTFSTSTSQSHATSDTISTKDIDLVKFKKSNLCDDLIRNIIKRMPQIKNICFDGCFLALDDQMNVSIDLSNLTHLEVLEFSGLTIDPFRRKSTYFKLDMANDVCMVYKSTTKNQRDISQFELVTEKHLNSYKRFQSHYSTVISIQCPRIDTIVFKTESRFVGPFEFEFHPWLDYEKSIAQ